MFKELKAMLLKNIDSLVALLEYYGFVGIQLKLREIRFCRDEYGGANISIKLENNESIIVHDFARGVSTDIFAYIVEEKGCSLKNVLRKTRDILKLDSDWQPQKKEELFGGFYNRIILGTRNEELLPSYPENILDEYTPLPNEMFLKDGISLSAQKYFHIMFDHNTDRIVIPLYDEFGRLIGVKGRINMYEFSDSIPKYLYLHECQVSKYLYGYFQNYQFLFGNTVVIGEAEKMVMQGWSMGVKNIVAIGSNALSEKQARLILQLNPKKIVLALDEGLPIQQTERNIEMIRAVMGVQSFEIWYWDYTMDPTISGTKVSPTDMGLNKYKEIMTNQLKRIL